MTASKPGQHLRRNLLLWALGALAAGLVLAVLSRVVLHSAAATQPASDDQTATTAPQDSPATSTQPARNRQSAEQIAAQNLSNMLLLCSLLAFGISMIALVWLGREVRRHMIPAWKRNPKRRW